MSFHPWLCAFFLWLLPLSGAVQQAAAPVEWAIEHLPQSGVLKVARDGFVYLKVDDRYIDELFPLLDKPEYRKPPYFRRPNAPGAHISVIYVDERHKTGWIDEIGHKYSFKITGMGSVPADTQEYIVLEVAAPGLERLREKYGLSPLLKGHQFHITIAKRKYKPWPWPFNWFQNLRFGFIRQEIQGSSVQIFALGADGEGETPPLPQKHTANKSKT